MEYTICVKDVHNFYWQMRKKTGCKGKTIEMKVCFQYKSTTKYAVYDNSGFSGVSREKQVIAYYLQITQKVKSSYCQLSNPVFFPKLRLSLMNERRTNQQDENV